MSFPNTHSSGAISNAVDYPAETLRLVTQCRDAYLREGKSWADFFGGIARERINQGTFLGRLWRGPGDEGVALAGWELAGEVGRRAWLYLAEGYQRRGVLEAFLTRLESAESDGPKFISWGDDVPGVAESERAAVFRARGFFPVVRADMRFPKEAEAPQVVEDPKWTPVSLKLSDESQIADLVFRVYEEDPVERALFATTLDPLEDAQRGTHGLLHGEVGRWIPEASFGIRVQDRLIAHTLANELHGGLITEVGVDPSFRRRGLARVLLSRTIAALRALGFDSPRLVVTLRNARAARLYESVGFQFVEGGSGRVWLNLPALGVRAPPE